MANITMVGSGYIGLVTGACFADRGNQVTCVDKNPDVVNLLNGGRIHIFEPGLEEIVRKNVKEGRLKFTQNLNLADSEFVFLGVNTPSKENGEFNLDYFFSAAEDVGRALKESEGYKIVVGKSTVPQGTSKKVEQIINEQLTKDIDWDYVSNPETLAEGRAVSDFSKPDRIIIGTESERAYQAMEELYRPFNISEHKVMRGSPADAELAKLFSNTALAARVAMINEFARIADVTQGADIDVIRRMVGEDQRIGHQFLYPGPGYGGSCFPKDIQGLTHQAKENGYEPTLLSRIHESNELHKLYVAQKVEERLPENPRIGVWGLTFKAKTDDMRDAASIPILTHLINQGATISAYDPQDEKAREIFKDRVSFTNNQYDAARDVDALLLLTEWQQFDSPDYDRLRTVMSGNQLFDMRNRWNPKTANEHGFHYTGIGRGYLLPK